MSLKILLADDNITAQRMASKILTEAGYEVIAVSNGAAAIKKIASERPGLLILDVYMPGYTGLEVCEKVRNDPPTAQLPVILTVTNMEPFNPQEGNRVRADGLMIKPFEATDLVAVVQKFEAKRAALVPESVDTEKTPAIEEFKDASYEEWKSEVPDEPESKKIEMSPEIASAPALGFDEPVAESVLRPVHPHKTAPSADFAVNPPAPVFGAAGEAAPAFHHSPAPVPWESAMGRAPSSRPAAEIAPPAELEYTSQQDVGQINVKQAAELEVAAPEPEAVIAQDPALVTDADELSQFVTKIGQEHPDDVTVGIAKPGLTANEDPPAPEESVVPEHTPPPALDYVSAVRMPTLVKPAPAPVQEPDATAEISALADTERPSPVEDDMHRAFVSGSSGAAVGPAPAVEPEQPEPSKNPPTEIAHLVAQFAAELDQVHYEREAMGYAEPPLEEAPQAEASRATVPEASIAPEAPSSQLDEERIAAAVNRALEKYKDGLRGELIQAIVRELKGS